MSELDTRTEIITSGASMMSDDGLGSVKQVFLANCKEFGGPDLCRKLLLHEHAMRNNLNAGRTTKYNMMDDYTEACKTVGAIMNRLQGKSNDYVKYFQIQKIKSGITCLYQEMLEWDVRITDNGFSFPEDKKVASPDGE